jgi:ribosomal protein S12 methylthiotransferase accessory factor
VWVPAAAVLTPYTGQPRLIGSYADGLASGNCLTEAVLHGLYELIERDATAFNEPLYQGTRVFPETLPDHLLACVRRVEAQNVDVALFYLASDTGIPVFLALLDDRLTGDGLLLNGGFGCHLSPEVAAARALTEAVQSRLCVIAGSREDLTRQGGRRDRYRALRSKILPWFEMNPTLHIAAIADRSSPDVGHDLLFVLARLDAAGLPTVLVADLSLPELPFSVTRAIVPGVEFFHEEPDRLGPRLARVLQARQPRG